jgi:hypothetical protein
MQDAAATDQKQAQHSADERVFARRAGNGLIYARRPVRQGASALTAGPPGVLWLLCRPTGLAVRVPRRLHTIVAGKAFGGVDEEHDQT